MKFGKSLSNQVEETLPEWRDKFLSYKDLKKRLKTIEPSEKRSKRQRLDGGDIGVQMTKEKIDFINLLEGELEKFNGFFAEMEEEYIIRQKELQERDANAKDFPEELTKVRKDIVDLHGEMVLLENYSALNYTGLVKILKKFDKRTGALIRLPFIQKVLRQPFFTTDLLYKLVKECEKMLDNLFPKNELIQSRDNVADLEEARTKTGLLRGESKGLAEGLYTKCAVSALRALKEIRSGSSTVSVFSLPPLQGNGLDKWAEVSILEQEAK